MWGGGAGSWVLPLYIMVLEGVLCLAVVYHGFTGRGGGVLCLTFVYHGFRGGVLCLAVVYHGFRGSPGSCRSISWLKGGGFLGLSVVYHGFRGGGGGLRYCSCIFWL